MDVEFMSKKNSLGPLLIVSGVLLTIAATILLVILPNLLKPPTTMWIGDGVFRTRIAQNDGARASGLSGVTKLESDQALLMIYPNEAKWGIWMKDMHIPIDIVWLDKNKKIVHIVKNVSPDNSTSKIFEPNTIAKYVVELPAGTVDSKAIITNQLARFAADSEDVQ